MERKKILDIGIAILIIACLVFMVFTYKFMTSNGKQCLRDPLTYFENLNNGAYCNCWKEGVPFREENYTTFIK